MMTTGQLCYCGYCVVIIVVVSGPSGLLWPKALARPETRTEQ